MAKARSSFLYASPAEKQIKDIGPNSRNPLLPIFELRSPPLLHLPTRSLPPCRPGSKKKKYSPGAEKIYNLDRRDLEKDLSTQPFGGHLGPLFKIDLSTETLWRIPTIFHKAPGVTTCVWDVGRYLKAWSNLFKTKNAAFPEIPKRRTHSRR